MDLLIAPGTVSLAQADTAPANGTPGYATAGTPGGLPPTESSAWHYNMMMVELRTIVVAAGLVPSGATWSQVLAALKILFAGSSVLVPYTMSTSIVVPAWSTSAYVEVVGGSGGAGGSGNPNSVGSAGSGPGYVRGVVQGLSPGASIPLTVGAGGLGGVYNGQNPLAGGTSSFGAIGQYLWATGGGQGVMANGAIAGTGAAPGNGFAAAQGVVDVEAYSGTYGGTGIQTGASNSALIGSVGGNTFGASPVGFVSSNGQTPQNGGSGTTPGQGGGGGISGGVGGAGAPGIVRVKWIVS